MKTCPTCHKEKPLSDFHKNSTRYDGVQSSCKVCCNIKYRKRYKSGSMKRSRKSSNDKAYQTIGSFITRYKKICGCCICGENEPIALDFHHVDPSTKERTVSELRRWSMGKVKKEIRKCVVLCANCHRKVHAGILQLDEVLR